MNSEYPAVYWTPLSRSRSAYIEDKRIDGIPGYHLIIDGRGIIKILGIAIGFSSCNDPRCIMVYRRSVQDVDRNQRVCDRCRVQFVEGIRRITDKG